MCSLESDKLNCVFFGGDVVGVVKNKGQEQGQEQHQQKIRIFLFVARFVDTFCSWIIVGLVEHIDIWLQNVKTCRE